MPKDNREEISVKVGGMDCTNCAISIKKALEKAGAENVSVDFTMGEAHFTKSSSENIDKYLKAIESSGYQVIGADNFTESKKEKKLKYFLAASIILTLPQIISMIPGLDFLHNSIIHLTLSAPVWIMGMLYFGPGAIASLKNKSPNMDVLVVIGSSAAFLYSCLGMIIYGIDQSHQYLFFETASSIITFILLGNYVEHRAVAKTTDAVRSLQSLQQTIAHLLKNYPENQSITNIDSGLLQPNDIILVKSGEIIPVDGIIIDNEALINESILTGEAMPVRKIAGDEVFGGTLIVNGNIIVKVKKPKSASVAAKIVEMVRKAQQEKAPIQQLGDKISEYFVPIVLFLSIITFVVSVFVLNLSLQDSLLRSIAVIVISCPCAMGLAAPTAIAMAIGQTARRAILVKNSRAFEWLAKSQTFVFDKTGTLTKSHPEVIDFYSANNENIHEILGKLLSAEQRSNHPVSKAIVHWITQQSIKPIEIKNFEEIKGQGIEFIDNDNNFFKGGSFSFTDIHDTNLKNNYDFFLTCNQTLVAAFRLQDELHQDMKKIVKWLLDRNKNVYLLSGDKKEKCLEIANKVGINPEHVFFEKKPDEKLQIIKQLKEKNILCMIGDGINDAPSLTAADVSISFGHASDIAMDAATVVISEQNIYNAFIYLMTISNITIKKIKQNYFWAFFYNILAIPIAAAGMLHPIIASLAMAFSDVIVVGNSLLIGRIKDTQS
ncbi:MAG: copper-translocating P-type ATPase [Bacteroidia bacterium]|nr:MAG: copper-translocating P-type ATPase [Bacteroidia bacterium]